MTDTENGLLQALLLDGQGGARQLDWNGVNAWKPEDGILWIHLDYTLTESVDWLMDESNLD